MNNETPTPHKVLVAIPSLARGSKKWRDTGTANDAYLGQLVNEYRSMSFQVDVVVFSDAPKEVAPGVELRVGLPTQDPGSLPFAHKQVFADRLNDYDLFIYSEDDTLITAKTIRAFLRVSSALPENEIPGFFRFERGPNGALNYIDVHGHFHWDPQTIRTRGEFTLAFFTNHHSSCYAATRQQLKRAIDSGGFLVGPHEGRYDPVCTAATDLYTQCGFQELVCISHLEDFHVEHLHNKYFGTRVDGADMRRQVDVLLRLARNGERPASLFPTESKLTDTRYSKSYYEPVRPEIISAIPRGARSVLSVGCGSGNTEAHLVERGLRVVAVPLDPAIATGAAARGVEIVAADLSTAPQQLAEERFDCLLLINVLHLVPDPVNVLSSFGALLPAGSVAVFSVPNLSQLPAVWGKIRRDPRFQDLGNYDKTGVHFTSLGTIREWCRRAGMRFESATPVLPVRARRLAGLALGLMDGFLASEFIAVAKRA
jgi:SAM-dependent methyltransferase